MIETKTYSTAKKMALVAAIIASINSFYNWVIINLIEYFKEQMFDNRVNSFINSHKGNLDLTPSTQQQEITILFQGLSLLFIILGVLFTAAFLIFLWFTFAKIDSHKEKPWRIIALICGIILSLMGIFGTILSIIETDIPYLVWDILRLATAIFMILSFALKSNNLSKE